ncbi:hypothetical protein [Helicobacter rodentium]|uniref:hypothetical protein n=1 Tax=Helicobacter rodentium TaxID=59617 RepID=UPI0023555826|nr:hypothetical protein [Helicobacter rodentium]
MQDYRLPRSLATFCNDAVVSLFLLLRGVSGANDEAIHNLTKSESDNGILKSEILCYGLPRKFFKFSRNDRAQKESLNSY